MKDYDFIVVKPNETREDVYQKFLKYLNKLGIQITKENKHEKK